ncbi:hypothetical protein T265_08615 [Opisthorchis viverrini]|uniref:Sec16 Sec23-binding domain-containing protein n=1 Tax=Opisthorchis viverrini TaxID=6198 RepID=A0A074Z8J3_OPIVI|nr:hypothetical protein T265_08615 [Opisthorchis viverrini]KER23536.1 hypothetical protein T265_08615 [Opisthorchis viverrini]
MWCRLDRRKDFGASKSRTINWARVLSATDVTCFQLYEASGVKWTPSILMGMYEISEDSLFSSTMHHYSAGQPGEAFLASQQTGGLNHAPFREHTEPSVFSDTYKMDYSFGQEPQIPQANFAGNSNSGFLSSSFDGVHAEQMTSFHKSFPTTFSTPYGTGVHQDSCNNAVVSTFSDAPQLHTLSVGTEEPQNQKVPDTVESARPSVGRPRGSPRGPPPSTYAKPVGKSSRLTAVDRARAVAKKPQKSQPAAPSGEKTDPFTQWYQMMSQYYSQFYPGYQLPQPPGASINNQPTVTNHPVAETTPRHLSLKAGAVQPSGPSYVRPGPASIQPTPSGTTVTGTFDYASYYYQYYYGMAASQLWPGTQLYTGLQPSGRKTPKLFHTPHIRAYLATPGIVLQAYGRIGVYYLYGTQEYHFTRGVGTHPSSVFYFNLQVLPTRPSDGELARIEMLDLGELASEAVAEAAKRLSEADPSITNLTRLNDLALDREGEQIRDGYSSGASGVGSSGRLSSLQAGAGGDDGEAMRACAAVAVAWDRTEHLLYPGPLNRSSTLKADVLAFLREKLAEMQDRLPIDWESAGLLLTFLEAMVKNNGNVQPSDLVNLLLEGHEPQTSELRTRGATNFSASSMNIGVSLPYSSNRPYLSESLASLSPSQPPSGRQSPQTSGGMHQFNIVGQHTGKAASETGGFVNTQALLRRAAAVAGNLTSNQHSIEAEDQILDRFRERIGPTVFDKVMDRFLCRAIPVADPILTLYQLTAGEMPQAVTTTAYGRGTDNGEWRPHLAMILAAESTQPELAQSALERLGDSLLSRRLVYAAHLCYLLMGPLCEHSKTGHGQPVYKLPEKIWLLGIPPGSTDNFADLSASNSLSAATEAIQLTEIYEYAMKLANRNYRLPQLLPFKLVYATRLLDAGLTDKANRYLTAIGNELLLEAADVDFSDGSSVPPVFYSLVANCLRLAEPLQYHPELDGFELTAFGGVSRSLGTPTAGRGNMRFGTPPTPTGASTNWLDRLRELYLGMHNRLRRPHNGSTNLTSRTPTQLQATTIKEEVAPIQHPIHRSAAENPQTTIDNFHFDVPGDPHLYSSSAVGSSSSSHPVSAYLVPAQTHEHRQAHQLESSSPPFNQSPPAVSSLEVSSHTISSANWPPTAYSQAPQGQSQVVRDTTKSLDRVDSGTPVNSQHIQMHYSPNSHLHHQPYQPVRLPDEGCTTHHTNPSSTTPVSYSQMIGGVTSQSSVYNHSDASDTFAPRQHPTPLSVDQPMQNSMFFTPFAPSPPPNTPGSGNTAAFDYFAGLQVGSRSRTVSGGSQSSQTGAPSPPAHGHPQSLTKEKPSNFAVNSTQNDSVTEASSRPVLTFSTTHGPSASQASKPSVPPVVVCDSAVSGDDLDILPEEVFFDEEEIVKGIAVSAVGTDKLTGSSHVCRGRAPRFNGNNSPLRACGSNPPCTTSTFKPPSPFGRCLSVSVKPRIPGLRPSPLPPLPLPVLSIGAVPCDRCECWHSLMSCENDKRVTQTSRSRSDSGGLVSQPRRNSSSFDRPLPNASQQLQTPRHISGVQRGPIKEEPQSTETKPEDGDHSGMNNQQSKEGWLSNWFGRLKRNGSKNIHLPDDSKPSIVWDDQQKQWIDTSNPHGREPTPPPPPMTSVNLPVNQQSMLNQSAASSSLSNPPIPRVSSRSRYVNVLANQTSGPAASKLDGPLQPPLPPTVFAPHSVSAHQDRVQHEDNLRPNHGHQSLGMDHGYRTGNGNASLVVHN